MVVALRGHYVHLTTLEPPSFTQNKFSAGERLYFISTSQASILSIASYVATYMHDRLSALARYLV